MVTEMLSKILISIFIVLIIVSFNIVTNFFYYRFVKSKISKKNETLILLILNSVKYIGLITSIIIVLKIFNVDTASIIAGAGFFGILFGLGFQRLLQDMSNGFFLIFEKQYVVGEYVSINGVLGEVLEIGLKTTKLLSYEGEYHFISNGDIKSVINYSRHNSLAVIDLPIMNTNAYARVQNIINTTLFSYNDPKIKEKPRIIGVQNINEYSYSVRIICETDSFEQFRIMRDLRERIIINLQAEKIEFFNIRSK